MLTIGPGDAETPTIRLWSLTDDALVETGIGDQTLVMATRWGEFDIGAVDELVRESLRRMGLGPISLDNVADGEALRAGNGPATALAEVLERLGCCVVHSLGLRDGNGPLLSAIPLVRFPRFEPIEVPGTHRVRLSRFATLRPRGGVLLLEVPGAQFAVTLDQHPAARVVSLLGAPDSVAGIARKSEIAHQVVADIVSFLAAAGVVLVGPAEDDNPELPEWAHHELLFHQRNRTRQREALPDHAPEEGAAVAPVVKAIPPGRRFPLVRPAVGELARGDPSLTDLLETDHRRPAFSLTEITVERLGELLFRAARIRSLGPAKLGAHTAHEASQRPYFNIACFYELDLYLSAHRCAGLPRGIYHYDPLEHALTLINESDADLSDMLDAAKLAAASTRQPSALITVTARMGRVSWALWGSAYSTAMMHLGALQQTLYLAAQAMGLSAHPVPVGANDVVDRSLGLEWPNEIDLGECVLDALGQR